MSVYVLNGEIVAARSARDDHELIRRLWAAEVIDIARVAALEATAELGETVFGVLLEEIDPDIMEQVLFERFRDNVASFLGHDDEPRFTELSAVFVDNIQMGHDSRRLVSECLHLWEKAAAIDPEAALVAAHPEDAAGEQVLVIDALGAGRNVRAVLEDVPLEPVWARAMIAAMLDTGILALADVEPYDNAEDEATFDASSEPSAPPESASEFAPTEIIEVTRPYIRANDGPTMETEIVESPRKKARKLAEVIAAKKTKAEEPPAEPPKKGKKGKAKAPEEELPELELDVEEEFEEDEPTVDSNRPAPTAAPPLPEVEEEPPFEEVDDADMPSGGEGMLDLDLLLRGATGVAPDEEIDLDAFADHDSTRGAEADGVFKTEDHNLDRVEVRALDDQTDEEPSVDVSDEDIEVDEAPHAPFSGKLLSDEEAHKKIEVANQAVTEVIQAFDASEGAGSGRATMQILLDGSPQRFAVLFQGMRLHDDELPASILLRNLHERPQTEHRLLLNQGLVDLIERALSLAMDEITDDAAIDTLLERTAGYRQRIGL